MRVLAARLIYGVVIAEVIVGFVLGVLAYFVRSVNQPAGIWYDGLGRQLEETPMVARLIFGAESHWAGWGYFTLDFLAFWGGIAVGYSLLNVANKFERKVDA